MVIKDAEIDEMARAITMYGFVHQLSLFMSLSCHFGEISYLLKINVNSTCFFAFFETQ